MDPISIIALILSVIAIMLWAYTFLFQQKTGAREQSPKPPESETATGNSSLPDVARKEVPSIQEQILQHEAQFMAETQKFSQMVRKNLEMLNTRVGIKFDVKPISERFAKSKTGPGYVDSMEVQRGDKTSGMLSDDSEEHS